MCINFKNSVRQKLKLRLKIKKTQIDFFDFKIFKQIKIEGKNDTN